MKKISQMNEQTKIFVD
jgi:hypothetical protein